VGVKRAVGGLLGVVGHAAAAQIFLDSALLTHADPHDRVMTSLVFSVIIDVFLSGVCLAVVRVCFRRGHRDWGSGILTGWAVGTALGLTAAVTVWVRISDWAAQCSCDPALPAGHWWDYPWTWGTLGRLTTVWLWPVIAVAGLIAAYQIIRSRWSSRQKSRADG
jgi:hypothetical protein